MDATTRQSILDTYAEYRAAGLGICEAIEKTAEALDLSAMTVAKVLS